LKSVRKEERTEIKENKKKGVEELLQTLPLLQESNGFEGSHAKPARPSANGGKIKRWK